MMLKEKAISYMRCVVLDQYTIALFVAESNLLSINACNYRSLLYGPCIRMLLHNICCFCLYFIFPI
ncbi:hypothetical protein MtrunA17_Chr4g0003131 [Medicago truncatula]|uniref:Transmembrane protein n=1 Tax=Medicago truncatula TaxID=3880 RepID=A0A396I189_MEDTR|nr:hypothetical protein MtrunA17_Chr4g0003131 [Medicago truncatula]